MAAERCVCVCACVSFCVYVFACRTLVLFREQWPPRGVLYVRLCACVCIVSQTLMLIWRALAATWCVQAVRVCVCVCVCVCAAGFRNHRHCNTTAAAAATVAPKQTQIMPALTLQPKYLSLMLLRCTFVQS